MDNEDLNNILNDTPETPAEAPAETAAEQAQRERDDKGRFVAKDTGETTPPEEAPPAAEAAPPAAEATIPQAALLDERRKRQELERQVQYLLSQQRQPEQPRTQPAPAPDFWEDPDGALNARLDAFGTTLIQRWEQQQAVSRANQAEAAAKAKYPDYDEVIGEFHRAAADNPRLAQEMFAAPDPAEFAYRRAKQTRELAEAGDLESLKARLRAEWEAEIKASLPSSITAPTTTAGLRSVGARSGPEWSGPTSISDILSP
jgi:hypothetical protein